jgi:hypothetical protein
MKGVTISMVEVFRRHEGGNLWVYQQFRSGQDVTLASINFAIPMSTLYQLTDILEQESEEE